MMTPILNYIFSKVRSVKNIKKISLNILKLHLSGVNVIYQITMHK